ncbi:proactivator polypeptide-like 1 isoform X1 [Passer montanus]|uniref:proactivator polypeptide-like 1 isoform X1 n=1 Tax=Passer montanus TaxID=9160 RepID=UPI00196173D2|nr:proactivator polypeptide-like 1 isoform X1 [Passer montanus]
MALALPLLLALLGTTPGLGAPGGGCGVPPSAWCQDWVTALRCGALGRCPRLSQGPPEMDACAVCQYFVDCLGKISNKTALEEVLEHVVGLVCPHLHLNTSCYDLAKLMVSLLLWDIQNLEPREVCVNLQLCPPEPGAALALPVLELPGGHRQDPKGATVPALSLSLGPCALGPIFWCSGPEAARRCQALQHCREHVWL